MGQPRPLPSIPRTLLAYAGVFSFALLVFAYVSWQPAFRDPDAFYHAKMASLILRSGIVREFPWLPFTTFSANFADHHFLYHLLLVPFAAAWGPLVGLKIATAVFAAAAAAAFYGLLRAYGVRRPWLYAAALVSVSGFAYRLGLGKASGLSVMALCLALILLRKGRWRSAALLSFLYVWTYGGWPLLVIAAAAHFLGRNVAGGGKGLTRADFRSAGAVAAGIVAGLIVNPYFPKNLAFFREQFVGIGVMGYKDVIAVGGEWYAPTLGMIVNGAGLALAFLAAGALAAFLAGRRGTASPAASGQAEAKASLVTAATLAGIFLLLMLRSYRHVEYFAPFAMLLAALSFTRAAASRASTAGSPRKGRFAAVIVLLALVAAREVRGVRLAFDRGLPWSRYEKAASWLQAHARPGETVFHSDWEDFPLLFYRNDGQRYIVGLDPAFFYRSDPALYRLWEETVSGRRKEGISDVMETFGTRLVFLRKDRAAMRDAIEADGSLLLVYEDDEAAIYEVRD